MTPDQLLRRWATRARRAVVGPGADHEPSVETDTPRPSPPAGARRPRSGRAVQATQFLSAFLLTLSIIAIGFALLSARLAQVRPDWSVAAQPATGASYALAAGDAALSLITAEDAYRDGFFFVPPRRKARLTAFQIGAASGIGAFAATLDERRRRSDPDLAAAAADLAALSMDAQPDMNDLFAGRESLARFSDRVADGRARYDPSSDGVIALALACQAAALAHTAELAAHVQHDDAMIASGSAEASFHRARGEAYAWRLLLSGYGRDMPPELLARAEPALSDLIAAAEDAADYQPLFLLNGPQQSPAVPNHLAHLAVKLTQVSAAAERLAAQMRASPPPA